MREVVKNKKKWFFACLSVIVLVAVVFLMKFPWSVLGKFLVVHDAPEPADVIVVLGGNHERELYAAELYRQGLAPRIIMTGCGPFAGQMAQIAVEAGVDNKDIIVESKSESTYDNARYSRDIVLEHHFNTAIVVSSPYHMRRSKLVFERVFNRSGVKLLYCPAKKPNFDADNQSISKEDRRRIGREYVKIVYYWLRYWH